MKLLKTILLTLTLSNFLIQPVAADLIGSTTQKSMMGREENKFSKTTAKARSMIDDPILCGPIMDNDFKRLKEVP